MFVRGTEDRLNPIAPEGADESTLAGYAAVHGRAPGFEGSDGRPYTPAIEVDAPAEPGAAWAAYLVFLRWAGSGTAVMGHLETGDLTHGETEAAARDALGAFPLTRVKQILDDTIAARGAESNP